MCSDLSLLEDLVLLHVYIFHYDSGSVLKNAILAIWGYLLTGLSDLANFHK